MGNDAERYRRFLDGDDNGLIEIIDEYHEGMSLYLNSIVNDMELAEDIMQDTFVKLAIKKPSFKGKCSFKTWLFTIARNCAFDHLRKKQKISDLSLDDHLQISDVTDTEKEFLREEQKVELYSAMKRLNPDYYQVLYLMYFEDLDTSDIAKIMHKAKRQVSDLIFRARKSLKTELERKGFIYERY
jgi:RNA polymerase sigma-70 factor (ECF subfamily)